MRRRRSLVLTRRAMYLTADSDVIRQGEEGAAAQASPDRHGEALLILRRLRRGRRWLALAAFGGAVAAAGITLVLTPRFTATTELTIAPSNLLVAPNDLYAANIQSDSQILDVESKMRMIASGNVLRRVVVELGLRENPEFIGGPWPYRLWGSTESTAETMATASAALARRIVVTRQERSYVVSLSVWASDGALAARLAGAIAEIFREEVARGDAERAGRAARGLAARLGEIKATATAAEERVEAFRRDHGLQQGASRQPLGAEALERMSAKLTDAKAKLAEAEARYGEISRAVLEHGAQAGGVQSQTLAGLLADEAGLRRRLAVLGQTLGPRHPALANGQAEAAALAKAIRAEGERLRRAARIEVEQAKRALDALSGETQLLRGSVSADDEAQVALRALEREAGARAALYQTFLTRAGEAAQRQQIDATDVRVITPPSVPSRPGWPPRPAVAAAAGALFGLLLAAAVLAGLGYLEGFRNSRSTAR